MTTFLVDMRTHGFKPKRVDHAMPNDGGTADYEIRGDCRHGGRHSGRQIRLDPIRISCGSRSSVSRSSGGHRLCAAATVLIGLYG